MSIPSNLYAEKIFAEHPLSLWALDEKLDYISLITEAQRNIQTQWSITGGTALSGIGITGEPFTDSNTTIIQQDVPPSSISNGIFISPNLINAQNLNDDLETFCVSLYYFVNQPYVFKIEIGYEYTDPITSNIVQNLQNFPISKTNQFNHIFATFTKSNVNANIRLVIKTYNLQGGNIGDYNIIFNGISFGQHSEEFCSSSLGVETTTLSSLIAIPSSQSVEAFQYGIEEESGYYLCSNNKLLAQNTSIPLVFGASNLTKLTANTSNLPSLIIPGKGMLNKIGQYKEYTLEFWMRINPNFHEAKKIVGPIGSTDGLYIDDDFLTLKIGDNFKSYFIGEWYRPMLVHINIIKNFASLLINGEEVISFNITTSELELPSEYNNENKNQDWIGFYSYDDMVNFELDCIAIYPYKVPITVAKKRWVYGQGVVSPENIDSSYGGISAFIDYPFAKYSGNYSYPDLAKWQQASFDNLVATNTKLSTPNYKLPEIYVGNKTIAQLYLDNKDIQNEDYTFITFRPTSEWIDDQVQCYFNFPTFDILNDQIHAIYGIFSSTNMSSEETLFEFYNTLTGNSFSIRKDGNEIHYYLTYNNVEQEIYTTTVISSGNMFAAGIHLQKIVDKFGGNVAAFFGNQNGIKVYVAGDQSSSRTFTGKIYSIGFSTSSNSFNIYDKFNDSGVAILTEAESLLNILASYTLLPKKSYDVFFLDIGCYGYWQDYVPLTYFGKNITNSDGSTSYALDMLQFNIAYPSPAKLLNNNDFPFYDTEDSEIKSYLTIQYVSDGANFNLDNFSNTQLINKNKIIKLDDYEDWQNTKFEIVDNTILYPLTGVDFNELAIVIHLIFNSTASISKPINLNRLEIASQSYNNDNYNSIGTRFGVNLYPYTKSGFYYDYKTPNPVSIYKKSTPYLYLTRNTGIEIRGETNPLVDRGIYFPINTTNAGDYSVSAMQMWLRYDQDVLSDIPVKIFEVEYKNNTIKFYAVANSANGQRGKIYAIKNNESNIFEGLNFYINGIITSQPVFSVKEWFSIGILFSTSLDYNFYSGGIKLTGNFVYNNIAYYQASSLKEIQSKTVRPWFKVLTPDGETYYDWQYWDNNFSWLGMYIIGSSEFYGINPSDIYNTYLGTNKIIIDDSEGMIFDAEKITIYENTEWNSNISTPV